MKKIITVAALILIVAGAVAALVGCGGSGKPVAAHCDLKISSGGLTSYAQSISAETPAQCAQLASSVGQGTAVVPSLPSGLKFVCADSFFDVFMTPAQIKTLHAGGLNPAQVCQ